MLDSKSKSLPKSIKPNLPSFKSLGLELRIYPLSISPPGSAHSAGPAPKCAAKSFFTLFGPFLGLPKRTAKFASKNHRTKCENRGFGLPKTLPKPFQNASEIDVPKNIEIFIDFQSTLAACRKSRTMILCAWPQFS